MIIDPSDHSTFLVEQYKQLKHYKEFETNNELDDKLIRFAIYMADKNSPVYKNVDKSSVIKEAAKLAGIKDKNVIEQLELSGIDKARKAITRYFAILHNLEHELWLSLLTSYNQFNYMLRMPVQNIKDPIKALEIKQKIAMQLRDYLKEIKSLERELFHDDYVKKLVLNEISGREIHYPELLADNADTVV